MRKVFVEKVTFFVEGLTNWCLLDKILYKFGLRNEGESCSTN